MTASAARMLTLIADHNPYGPGPLHSYRPWPAYAVAMLVANLDDTRKCSTTVEDVVALLRMQPATAARHLRQLAKAGWLRRSSDDGWVPAWVDDSPAACPANPAETAADGPQAARDGLVRGMHGPAPS
ncbi:hypothetical protein AB0D90_03655 [Streptomyces althioticus]|uniref:HTH marR-type domain-containing protein n=1 Tax=Streptomyces cellulosae TaxID=1968 RepID=A0ABW6JIR1_STRCE